MYVYNYYSNKTFIILQWNLFNSCISLHLYKHFKIVVHTYVYMCMCESFMFLNSL